MVDEHGTIGVGSSLTQKYAAYMNDEMLNDIQALEAENRILKEKVEQGQKLERIVEAFFQKTNSFVVLLDRNYNYLRVNEAYAKNLAREVSDFPGRSIFEFYPSDARGIFDQVMRTKERYISPTRPYTFSDHPEWGVTYWVWTIIPVLDTCGEVDLLIFDVDNITEQVRAQEKLRESEEHYRAIFEHSLDGIILSLPNGTALSANPAACRMLGRTEEEIRSVGRAIFDLADPKVLQAFRDRNKTGSNHLEMTLVRKDGTKFPGEFTSKLFEDSHGHVFASTIFRDITERKQSEEALRLSEEKFSKAFHQSQTIMSISGLNDGVYMDVNGAFMDAFGYSREELIGNSAIELNLWVDPNDRQEALDLILKNGYIQNRESKFRKKSGEIGIALSTISLFEIGREKYLITSASDITERKQAEEALRLSQELFYRTFNTNPLPMFIVSITSGKIMEVNDSFILSHGYTREELIGRCVTDLNYCMDLSKLYQFIEGIKKEGIVKNHEIKFRNKSGEISTLLLSGVHINWRNEQCSLGIANDITELKRYQQESARLERLHLVGQMAAGIGHEIRNPMTTVKGFLQLLRRKERYAQDQGYMDLMIEELDRNAIITEYLALARNKAAERKLQSLNERIDSLYPLLTADVTNTVIDINLELGDIPDLLIDKNEIHQLLLNLVRNGIEAMEPGGVLTIKTFREDHEVILAVQDQGPGIAPEVLEKIGMPFFTTKDSGTGLGLATCYSIAQRHNAKIDIATSPAGTTFYVRFKIN